MSLFMRLLTVRGVLFLIGAALMVLAGGRVWADSVETATTTFKIGTIAPEGSTWDRVMRELNTDLQEKTQNRVRFQIYAGGVAGDEEGILRKIRIGQLDGGGFTGVGMGEVLPEVRILDLPFFLIDEAVFDRVRDGLTPRFRKGFADKGFILVGWVDMGLIYLYSAKPIINLDAFKKTKVWIWEGDMLVQFCMDEVGVTPVPLSVIDVMLGLNTGMIDTVYNTPLGCVALQWYIRTRYHTSTPLGLVTAGFLVRKELFDRLSKEDQQTLLSLAEVHFMELRRTVRKQDVEATRVMEARGVQAVKWPQEDIHQIQVASETVCRKLIGKLYPQELMDEALRLKAGCAQASPLP